MGQYGKLLLQKSGIEKALLEGKDERLVILDQACGTGVVTNNFMEMLKTSGKGKDNIEVTCADLADSMVELVGRRSVEEGWGAEVLKCDAQVRSPFSFRLLKFSLMFLKLGYASPLWQIYTHPLQLRALSSALPLRGPH